MSDSKKITISDNMSFEDAMRSLEEIVKRMETGKAPLDEAMRDYERGALLKQHCAKKLSEAKAKIETITVATDGKISTKPFEGEPRPPAGEPAKPSP